MLVVVGQDEALPAVMAVSARKVAAGDTGGGRWRRGLVTLWRLGSMGSVHIRMIEVGLVIGWVAFWLYWVVASFSMTRGRIPWSRELGVRAVIVVVVVVLVRSGVFRDGGLSTDPWRGGLGLALCALCALCALGLGFAMWARVHLGRNWGSSMTQKSDPELVTRRPLPPGSPSDLLICYPLYKGSTRMLVPFVC